MSTARFFLWALLTGACASLGFALGDLLLGASDGPRWAVAGISWFLALVWARFLYPERMMARAKSSDMGRTGGEQSAR
jgi:hypothetical protein